MVENSSYQDPLPLEYKAEDIKVQVISSYLDIFNINNVDLAPVCPVTECFLMDETCSFEIVSDIISLNKEEDYKVEVI